MSDQIIKLETLELARQAGVNLPRDPCNYTQTLVQRWLREKHDIHIMIYCYNKIFKSRMDVFINDPLVPEKNTIYGWCETYEDALEDTLVIGLKYVIENKK